MIKSQNWMRGLKLKKKVYNMIIRMERRYCILHCLKDSGPPYVFYMAKVTFYFSKLFFISMCGDGAEDKWVGKDVKNWLFISQKLSSLSEMVTENSAIFQWWIMIHSGLLLATFDRSSVDWFSSSVSL